MSVRGEESRSFLGLVCCAAVVVLLSPGDARASGTAWESFLAFPTSTTGRTQAVAIVDQGTLYVLGGRPYRCPSAAPCQDPERGAADYLTLASPAWTEGQPFDDQLQNLGGGLDSLGRPVAFGGAKGDDTVGTDQTFFYDIVLGDQTEPSLTRRNFDHTNFAWAVDDRARLYSIGGGPGAAATAVAPNVADVERYDAATDTWTILTPLPSPRANATAAFDGQGHILVFGGYDTLATQRLSDVQSYDIATDTWSTLGQLPAPPAGGRRFSDQRSAFGADRKVYIVGGVNGLVGSGTTRPYVYTYEPVTAAWAFAPDLATPRHAFAMAVDEDGWLYALGGLNGATGLDTNERFDTTPNGSECVAPEDCSDGLACNGEEFCVDGTCLAGIPVECAAGEFCATGGACRTQRFDMIDLSVELGGAGGPVSGSTSGINAAGHVVGTYVNPTDGQQHGFLWAGAVEDLGTGGVHAISSDGWIVGQEGTAFVIDPVTRVRTDLGVLGGASSAALGVATGGWVAGESDVSAGADRAFLVRGGGAPMEDLGTLGDYSLAHGVNSAGLVVGESLVTSFDPHAEPFVYDTSQPTPVMVPMGGLYSAGSARAVTNAGHITGWISNNVDNWGHAFVYDGGTLTDLGAVLGKSYSIGRALNGLDHVVGHAFGEWVDTGCCGVVWSNAINVAYFHDGVSGINLHDELPENSGWFLTIANGINDAGVIVGNGSFDGLSRAWMLVPHGHDQDLDGLADALEIALGTNTFLTDTDGDTLSDFDEVARDGDPDSYDPLADTNPLDADTDGDGIPDAVDPEPLVPAPTPHATPAFSSWAQLLLLLALGLSAFALISRRGPDV